MISAIQGSMTVAWPGETMEMHPPHRHMHWLVLLRAGMLLINTVGDPGAHGAGVLGTQGTGVSTPRAADVAAATAGLARLVHMPKGMMFTRGA